jgi:hypothetical protein
VNAIVRKCLNKSRFATEAEVETQRLLKERLHPEDGHLAYYHCPCCGGYHLCRVRRKERHA